jgi:hypothetical protein
MKTLATLGIGSRGKYLGVRFVVRGRLELRHESGSTWDEWYAAFEDGRDGWIACEGRRWLVTFGDTSWLPQWKDLGSELPSFRVVEKGRARFAAAHGKLPFTPKIGRRYRYADLRGPDGAFATIDYGDDPPSFFVGREASFEELAIEATAPSHPRRTQETRLGGK